jgi:hypothetical protein
MSQYTQQNGLNSCRVALDDNYDGKTVFQFSPLQGELDGTNATFQIPQSRIVIFPGVGTPTIFPQLYKNSAPLAFNTDYTVPNAKQGLILFATPAIPKPGDALTATFNWTWWDDIELDQFLTKGANEIGFTTYYCSSSSVPGTIVQPIPGGSIPTDIPDGLFNAITLIAAGLAARALAMRFSLKYDISAGDQSFSPSQMAKSYSELAKDLEKRGYAARDDFYKGQGRQYRPATAQQGYVLPTVTPKR